MALFRYRALNEAGKEVKGTIDALNKDAATQALQELSMKPVEVEEFTPVKQPKSSDKDAPVPPKNAVVSPSSPAPKAEPQEPKLPPAPAQQTRPSQKASPPAPPPPPPPPAITKNPQVNESFRKKTGSAQSDESTSASPGFFARIFRWFFGRGSHAASATVAKPAITRHDTTAKVPSSSGVRPPSATPSSPQKAEPQKPTPSSVPAQQENPRPPLAKNPPTPPPTASSKTLAPSSPSPARQGESSKPVSAKGLSKRRRLGLLAFLRRFFSREHPSESSEYKQPIMNSAALPAKKQGAPATLPPPPSSPKHASRNATVRSSSSHVTTKKQDLLSRIFSYVFGGRASSSSVQNLPKAPAAAPSAPTSAPLPPSIPAKKSPSLAPSSSVPSGHGIPASPPHSSSRTSPVRENASVPKPIFAPRTEDSASLPKKQRRYFSFVATLRLYAGWLFAWYGLVVALGYYAHVRSLAFSVPFVEGLFLSPLVTSFLLATFFLLLFSSLHAATKGGIVRGFLLSALGISSFWYVKDVLA